MAPAPRDAVPRAGRRSLARRDPPGLSGRGSACPPRPPARTRRGTPDGGGAAKRGVRWGGREGGGVAARTLVLHAPQRQAARLAHLLRLVVHVRAQRLEAARRCDGAQRLRRLVAHHGVLAGVLQQRDEDPHRLRVLHLAQAEGNLVAQQCGGVLQACTRASGAQPQQQRRGGRGRRGGREGRTLGERGAHGVSAQPTQREERTKACRQWRGAV